MCGPVWVGGPKSCASSLGAMELFFERVPSAGTTRNQMVLGLTGAFVKSQAPTPLREK